MQETWIELQAPGLSSALDHSLQAFGEWTHGWELCFSLRFPNKIIHKTIQNLKWHILYYIYLTMMKTKQPINFKKKNKSLRKWRHGAATLENSLVVPQNVQPRALIWPSHFTAPVPKRTSSIYPHKSLYTNALSKQLEIDEWISKVWFTHPTDYWTKKGTQRNLETLC